MARYRETLLGSLLIIFVAVTTVASIVWPVPAWPPAEETGSALLLSEPAAQPAPPANLHAWRDDFAVAYRALTALLALFAGLVCGVACLRRFIAIDRLLDRLHKPGRPHLT